MQQYRINRLFKVDQKKVYNEFNGKTGSSDGGIPNAEGSRTFCSGIWSVEKKHNKEAKWFSDLKEEIVKLEQQNVVINESKGKKQCSKMPNWKTPGLDGVQGFWIKRLDKMHERIATQLNEILEETKEMSSWMTYGKTVLCQKDPVKGNSVENFRPITCLPLMWKLLTGIISEDMYCFMENENLLPEEQKGCRRKSRGTKDQLLIDKTILKDCRKRRTNLAMAWIDYRKVYDFVPHSWILESLDMLDNVRSLSLLLRKVKASYEWGRKEFKLNHLLFMDDLTLFGKSED